MLRKLGATLAVMSVTATTAMTAMTTANAAETGSGYTLDRTLADSRITESSGIARSGYGRNVVFTHNDSGDSARVFAVGAGGRTKAVLTLKGAKNLAWEDMSTGPKRSLWVGDLGDGPHDRAQVSVYKFAEPKKLRNARVATTEYTFEYAEGAHNAEALMVHPKTGRVYVITKADSGAAIYVAPKTLSTKGTNKLTKVASAPRSVTGAAFAPGGKKFALTNYTTSFIYSKVGGTPRVLDKPQLHHGESVEFKNHNTLLLGSEGANSPVYSMSVKGAVTTAPNTGSAPVGTKPTPVKTSPVTTEQPVESAPSTEPFLFGMGGGNYDPASMEDRLGAPVMIHRIYHSRTMKVDGAVKWVKDDIVKGRAASEISFKVPLSWPDMAAGKGDYFFTEVATKIKAAVAGTDHRVMLAFNHEPEDDFKDATAAEQDRQRDAWKAMQDRAAGFFKGIPNVEYGVIFMGYHSFPNLGSALYPRWSLANAVPDTAELDYIGLDVYEDASAPAKFRPFETRYFKPMQAFAAQRGVEWGLSETGLTEQAFNARPTWFTDMVALLKKYDGSFLDYFNTNLNSIATWSMTAGDNREKAFGVTLREELEGN